MIGADSDKRPMEGSLSPGLNLHQVYCYNKGARSQSGGYFGFLHLTYCYLFTPRGNSSHLPLVSRHSCSPVCFCERKLTPSLRDIFSRNTGFEIASTVSALRSSSEIS